MIGFNGNGRVERPKGYYRDKIKLFYSSGSGLNHNRVSYSILLLALIFLMVFIIAGFTSLPRYNVELPYKELSLNVFDFSKPVNDFAGFLNNVGGLGANILKSISAKSQPTKLFVVQYYDPDYSSDVYVVLYGLYNEDFTQFSKFDLVEGIKYYRLYFVGSDNINSVNKFFNIGNSGVTPNFMKQGSHYSGYFWIGSDAADYNIWTQSLSWSSIPFREFRLNSLMFLNCYEYHFDMEIPNIRYFD